MRRVLAQEHRSLWRLDQVGLPAYCSLGALRHVVSEAAFLRARSAKKVERKLTAFHLSLSDFNLFRGRRAIN
jgi:hypothetical protein